MSTCPFCGRDPYHYVDVGVGLVPAAVDCCDLGDAYFRGHRPNPDTVTVEWDDFVDIGAKLVALRSATDALKAAQEFIRNGVEFGYIQLPYGNRSDPAHKTLPKIIDALHLLDEARHGK